MDTAGATYNLGIDGLPLGAGVAAAVDGAVVSAFTVDGTGVRIGGLAQRICDAVAAAEARMGSAPTEVRLVLVDDGADGTEVEMAAEWLAGRSISFSILDLVGPDGAEGEPADEGSRQSRSMSRAADAALR